jgi:hypothetical protein
VLSEAGIKTADAVVLGSGSSAAGGELESDARTLSAVLQVSTPASHGPTGTALADVAHIAPLQPPRRPAVAGLRQLGADPLTP